MGNPERKTGRLGRLRGRLVDNIKVYFKDGYEFGLSGWGLGQVAGTCEHENETSGFVRCGEFFTSFL